MTFPEKIKIVVLGGGAAGYFAAIHAARNGSDVSIIEKSGHVLSKVRVSGGGRCNVTNALTDPKLLATCYPRGSRELLGPLTRFGSEQTVEWFRNEGVQLKTEADGRIFPVTDSSQTIIDCLQHAASDSGVRLILNTNVKSLKKKDEKFELLTSVDTSITADKVIIATGGSPVLKNYQWIIDSGHTISEPVPSLFTFNIPQSPFLDLMGVSVQDCRIKIEGTKTEQQGPLLFTHWGLSGPAVLRLSAWAARQLADMKYNFRVSINFLPELNELQTTEMITEKIRTTATGSLFISPFRNIPSRLWQQFCFLAGATEGKRWNECSKQFQNRIVQLIRNCSLEVKGKTTFKEEFVTCGGVSLKEVNMKTMESKIISGLYFAGEVLDIDGITGGFNFQSAWTTGFIAGNAASGMSV